MMDHMVHLGAYVPASLPSFTIAEFEIIRYLNSEIKESNILFMYVQRLQQQILKMTGQL